MGRPYSDKFLRELADADETNLGVRLAKVCVEANLPTAYVAQALETTRLSVSYWFRGRQIRAKKHPAILAFMSLVREDIANGRLPAKSTADAKLYISEMIGIQL